MSDPRPRSLQHLTRLKVAFYTARGTFNQSARWNFWAQQDGARSVGVWLERLADREVLRLERERGVRDPIFHSCLQ